MSTSSKPRSANFREPARIVAASGSHRDGRAVAAASRPAERRRVGDVLVEVWSDVVCPWCYIGKRRFSAAPAELAADPAFGEDVEGAYRPYQLDPKAPPGTAMPVVDAYARKFGGYERAEQIIDPLTTTAAEDGLEFHLEQAQRANTRDAHRLLWFAEHRGPAGAQEALK